MFVFVFLKKNYLIKAFENWCFHELNTYNQYTEAFADFFYWRLASGTEVDFIVNDMKLAIEAKATTKVTQKHLKGLRSLMVDHPDVQRRVVVCCESKHRTTDDGIEIMPAEKFIELLWQGDLF